MSKKVFELAKELDMGAIDLVDKLRGIGLPVRNHMATLTDDELAKAMLMLRPADTSGQKEVKKPVRRKATATTAASTSDKEPTVAAKTSGVVTVKRKTVNKESEEETAIEEAQQSSAVTSATVSPSVEEENSEFNENDTAIERTPQTHVTAHPSMPSLGMTTQTQSTTESTEGVQTAVEVPSPPPATETPPVVMASTLPAAPTAASSTVAPTKGVSEEKRILRGLRVVSMPEVKKPVPKPTTTTPTVAGQAPVQQQTQQQPAGVKKEYLKSEKMFSFTPIYTPPPQPEKKATPEKSREFYVAPDAARDDLDAEGKKRLGGLAAMVAKPKGKTRDMTQIRADEELKTYTGELIGRVIYRNIGKKRIYDGPSDKTKILGVKESNRVLELHKSTTAEELAHKLKVTFREFQAKSLALNLLVIPEDFIGLNLAAKLAALYGYKVEDISFDESKFLAAPTEKNVDKNTQPRNPIITIMGHVDHGKTTLLDTIRKTKVASAEAGGITQHIGAYSVKAKNSTLTFLDTPGHAAFGAMRQRGANATDIVVLVVAADDGVMPQTKESIRYAQNAGCPIIVAINKMDREGANPDKVKQALMEFELTPEEWGGSTQYVPVSALKNQGIDALLDCIAVQSEMMELRADAKGPGTGVVIESKVETGRGPMATLLVQEGTLNKGDYIVVGETMGRARSLIDAMGAELKSAGPSMPVQVLGLEAPPHPGDIFNVVKSEREATKIVDNRINERVALANAPAAEKKSSLEDFFKNAEANNEGKKTLKLVIRSDVQGSYEAIKNAVEALGNNEVAVQVIGGGVGPITDTDVKLGAASKGYIIGFNMRPVTTARKMAEDMGVDIKNYSIIYNVIDDVTKALEGLLEPEQIEVYLGRAEVRNTFTIPKIGTIAGSAVIDGKILRGCQIRLLRDGKIVFDGKMSSLKRFKDDAREVQHGYECGIGLENYNDVKVSDIFEAYQMEKRARKLDGTVVAKPS